MPVATMACAHLLEDPKVIVQHFTGSHSYRSAYDTFARDVPDVELHELPGVCAHFIIDRRGVIHQLVSLRLMCRHTVGLNWTAVGIEHVGISDARRHGNRRQLARLAAADALAPAALRDPRRGT